MRKYAGADWLRTALDNTGRQSMILSPLGTRVADLLGDLFCGIYHWEQWSTVKWSDPDWIAVLYNGEMATYDFNLLTRLVFLAHRDRLRVSIEARTFKHLRITFYDRSATNMHATWPHPSLAEAVARFEAEWPRSGHTATCEAGHG